MLGEQQAGNAVALPAMSNPAGPPMPWETPMSGINGDKGVAVPFILPVPEMEGLGWGRSKLGEGKMGRGNYSTVCSVVLGTTGRQVVLQAWHGDSGGSKWGK